MKKIIFLLSCIFISTISVSANTSNTLDFCDQNGVLWVFKIVGYVLFIIKIVVPILIVIFGMVDFSRAVIASKDDEIKKASVSLLKRVIAGLVIFLVPTIINFAFTLVTGASAIESGGGDSNSKKCVACIVDPGGSCEATSLTE